ncbi:MAG: hypothetical protein M1839_004255 [Geoglossum umbratile]|nr:MAG: hypothetical protein M1839_004255 [Geoglossum umbratile]
MAITKATPTAAAAAPLHPYYPLSAEIAGYIANEHSVTKLLICFGAGVVVVFSLASLVLRRVQPGLGWGDKGTVLWFALSGFIHFFFEGYFVVNHTRMGPAMDLFGQLWKEYSLSDSRYLTSDPFVLCMEAITAIAWGPLSFLVAGLIMTSHPLRHPIQIIVALGQLYGDVLYYATSMFDLYYKGVSYCRPEPYYFWFYYFFMNILWIIIPLVLLYNSASASARAFTALDKVSKRLQVNGAVKKGI